MENFIKGTCEEMCPKKEYLLRTKERLLHYYEWKGGQKHVPGILVKSFSRSAAGAKRPAVTDLRTERCLQNTIEYLLKEIMLNERKPFNIAYEFIFDRLRAVRQEIVIQNFDAKASVRVLEPIVMFLSYSRYSLCEENVNNFDPKICDQHLQECLKRVLCCYDELWLSDELKDSTPNRYFIESLYQIFNMGSETALRRGLTLPKKIRNDHLFRLSHNLSLNLFCSDYYKTVRKIKDLPHILCAVASLKLPYIRKKMLAIFSHSYNSSHLCVPNAWLQDLLLYTSVDELISDCDHFNIETDRKEKCVRFCKNKFLEHKDPVKTHRERFVEDKLKLIYLPDKLLFKILK